MSEHLDLGNDNYDLSECSAFFGLFVSICSADLFFGDEIFDRSCEK